MELGKQQNLLTRKLEELKTEMASVQVGLERQKQEYEMAVAQHEAESQHKEAKLKLYQELLGLEIETIKGMQHLTCYRKCNAVQLSTY